MKWSSLPGAIRNLKQTNSIEKCFIDFLQQVRKSPPNFYSCIWRVLCFYNLYVSWLTWSTWLLGQIISSLCVIQSREGEKCAGIRKSQFLLAIGKPLISELFCFCSGTMNDVLDCVRPFCRSGEFHGRFSVLVCYILKI